MYAEAELGSWMSILMNMPHVVVAPEPARIVRLERQRDDDARARRRAQAALRRRGAGSDRMSAVELNKRVIEQLGVSNLVGPARGSEEPAPGLLARIDSHDQGEGQANLRDPQHLDNFFTPRARTKRARSVIALSTSSPVRSRRRRLA